MFKHAGAFLKLLIERLPIFWLSRITNPKRVVTLDDLAGGTNLAFIPITMESPASQARRLHLAGYLMSPSWASAAVEFLFMNCFCVNTHKKYESCCFEKACII